MEPSLTLDLRSALSGNYFLNASRSFDGSWIILSSDKDFIRRDGNHTVLFPPFRFQIHEFNGREWHVPLEIGPSAKRYSRAQSLPKGNWLLVCARVSKNDPPNADIFDEKGRFVSSLYLGDAIEDVQTTASGDIWVSYFDEGALGGAGIEQSGLVCFDSHGEPTLRLWPEITEPHTLPPVDDLYALNVCCNGDVWCSYYSDFPLVKLTGTKWVESWIDFPRKAIRAFAVNGDRLLAIPAYKRTGLLYLCDLKAKSLVECQINHADRRPLEFDLVMGRDSTLGFLSIKDPERPVLHQLDFH